MRKIDDYADFHRIIWDKISYDLVTDELYERYEDFLSEYTFNFFTFFQRSYIYDSSGELESRISLNTIIKLMESQLTQIKRNFWTTKN